MATKKKAAGKKTTAPKQSLADFIRSQPISMGPTAIVQAAAKAGYGKVDPTYVSKVRPMRRAHGSPKAMSSGDTRPMKKGSPAPKKATSKGPAPRGLIQDHGEETMIRFLELAKALGKDRARRLLELL